MRANPENGFVVGRFVVFWNSNPGHPDTQPAAELGDRGYPKASPRASNISPLWG